ncbi:MAG: class I SAM-dependent methyltransferase [Draconibacterium sp.]
MTKFNVLICPVCSGNSFSTFLTTADFFVSGEEFTIKQCSDCGFKITENIEDEENIGRYYQSEKYISHSNTTKGLINSIYHAVRKFMLGQKRKLVEKSTGLKNGELLDVGTGTGFFLSEMKEKGWHVTGTEKSSDARQFAKKEFGLNNLPSEGIFELKENSFDAITLWHVLEHIHQLNYNFTTFNKLLKEKGKLIIAVPNYTSYDAKHYKQFWAAYDVPRHIWHFAPEQMQKLGDKHQFKLLAIRTMPFDSFYVSLLSEKYMHSKLALAKGLFHGTISWLKSMIKPGYCSSVIYIFEKSNSNSVLIPS